MPKHLVGKISLNVERIMLTRIYLCISCGIAYDFNMQTHPNTSATYNQSIVMGENVIIFPLSYGDA